MPDKVEVEKVLGHLFRHEAGRMAAVLTRYLGTDKFEVAEDLVQDTLLKAMETWPFHAIPENPSAWLYKVAKNKAIDFTRARQAENKTKDFYQQSIEKDFHEAFAEDEIKDSVLRMMFVCCHPSIPPESQIALTLKTLGGLSTAEIANAFLTNEETIAKRIYRAKAKIKEEGIKLESLGLFDLPNRLNSVLKILYLIFNEGYYSSTGSAVVREDLCEEAMRLAYLLLQHRSTNRPKVKALMALMCLHAARFDSRTSTEGDIILLEHQDRSRWNWPLIEKGMRFLEDASEEEELSEYHVEAAIASVHSSVRDFKETRWDKLVSLYEALYSIKPSPMVELNRAIAIGYANSAECGIIELEKIATLPSNCFYLCAMGNFLVKQGDYVEAKSFYEKAMSRATSTKEIEVIKRKIDDCLALLLPGQ